MWRRPACQILSKALDISSAAAPVAPDLLKALAILSDTTVRGSTVDQVDVKPYCKWEKRLHFSRWSTVVLFTSFSKTLLTNERRLTGRQFLAVDLSPTFLNIGTTNETFLESGKQDSFRQLFKSSSSIKES